MQPWRLGAMAGIVLLVGTLAGQEASQAPQKGKIKKIDADKSTLTISVDGKDQDLLVAAETKVMDAANKQIENPFKEKTFIVGAAVMFKAEQRDGKNVLAESDRELNAAARAHGSPGSSIDREDTWRLNFVGDDRCGPGL